MKHLLLAGTALVLLTAALEAQVVAPAQPVRPVPLPIGRPIRPIGPPIRFPGGGDQLPVVKVTKEQLPKLIKDLESEEPEQLLTTVISLAELGPDSAEAVPGLIKALSVKNEDVRLNAALALSKVGKAAVPALTKALGSDSPDVRFYSVWALGWIGAEARASADAVLGALQDKDSSVRRKAIYALGRIGGDPKAAVPALLQALNDEKDDVRSAAAEAVAAYGKEAVPGLVKALGAKGVGRQDVINALGHVGIDAKNAIPELGEILENEPALSNAASEALGKIGREAIPVLEKALKNDKAEIRSVAVNGLAKIGVNAGQSLVDALGSQHVDVRRQAAQVLGPLNIGDKMVVLGLAYAVRDEDDQVKMNALQSLQQLGQAAKAAAPKLREALLDTNPQVRIQSFYALQNMGENPQAGLQKGLESTDERTRISTAALMCQVRFQPQLAAPILREALKHKDLALRMTAAHALAMTRQELNTLVPVLVEALKDGKSSTRLSALQALQQLGGVPQTQAALPGVMDCLKDENPQCRLFAIYALQNMGGEAKTVIPALEKLMSDSDVNVRRAVVNNLYRYRQDALPIFLRGIEDKDASIRQQSIWGLQNLGGQKAEQVLPVLQKLAKDRDASVRMSVVQVAQQYGKAATSILIDLLKDENASVKQQALWGLANNQQHDIKPALPSLVVLMKENNPNYQWALMQLLPRAGKEALPHILENLQGDNENARQMSMQALSQLRNLDRSITQVITKLARDDKNPTVRGRALVALVRQEPELVKEALVILNKEDNAVVRTTLLQGINTDLGGNVKLLLPFVNDSLASKDANVQQIAVQACTRLGPMGAPTVRSLIPLLKEGQPFQRSQVARALGNMGAAAKEAVSALEEASRDGNRQVASAAQFALRRIKGQ